MKNSVLNVIGTLIVAFSQWIQILLILRILGIYEVGLYALFMAIGAPLMLFTRYGFHYILPTNINHIGVEHFYNFRTIMNFLFVLASTLSILIFSFHRFEIVLFITYIVYKFFENKNNFVFDYLVAIGKIKELAIAKVLKGIFIIIGFAMTIFLTQSFLFSLIFLLIFELIFNFVLRFKYVDWNTSIIQTFSIVDIYSILKIGISITLVVLLSSWIANFPKYYIELTLGTELLGVFTTLIILATLVTNIVLSINQSYIKKFVDLEKSRSNKTNFRNTITKYFFIYSTLGFFILITSLYLSENIIVFVYGEMYREYSLEISLLCAYVFLIVIFKYLEMVLSVLNLYNFQLGVQMFALVFLIVLIVILIKDYEISGVFYSLISVYAVMIIIQGFKIILSLKNIDKNINDKVHN